MIFDEKQFNHCPLYFTVTYRYQSIHIDKLLVLNCVKRALRFEKQLEKDCMAPTDIYVIFHAYNPDHLVMSLLS